MAKAWLHAALAAIVLVSACALTVPRIMAQDTGNSAVASARATQRAVEVRISLFEMTPAVAGQFGIRVANGIDSLSGDTAKILASLQHSKNVKCLFSPTFSMLDHQEGTMSVSALGSSNGTTITVFPRILADGTVSIHAKVYPTSSAAAGSGSPDLDTSQPVPDGKTAIVVGSKAGSRDLLVLTLTPKITK